MGATVDGVADVRDFLVCREIGCTLMSGPVTMDSRTDPLTLADPIERVVQMIMSDRRRRESDSGKIRDAMVAVNPIRLDAAIDRVLSRFLVGPDQQALVVIDAQDVPFGIIPEIKLKAYT